MTFIDNWQKQLPISYTEFAWLVATSPQMEAGPGLLGAAILWPIRQAIQEFEGEALDAVRDICGAKAKHIFKTVQSWGDDPLMAAQALTVQAKDNPALADVLHLLSQHFQSGGPFAEALAQTLVEHQGSGDVYNISGQIKAALVNIGGTISIQSLTLHVTQAAPQLQIAPPPEPVKSPEISAFVGRQAELAYYADSLATSHQAIITGMAGIGKTVVAAMLIEVWKARAMLPAAAGTDLTPHLTTAASGNPDKVFWHTFFESDSVNVIIWKLAGFLAWHGQTELWELLQSTQQTGGQLPPPASLFDYLCQMIRQRGYLLCFDAIQFIDDDPLLDDFVRRLQPLVQAGEIALIITSRHMPQLGGEVEIEPLTGLSLADTQILLQDRGLILPEEQAVLLYSQTEGNPQLLVLAINLLKQAKNPSQVITRLAEVDDLERYLIREVDDTLLKTDREVMVGVAILLGYPGTRQAIETTSGRDRLKRHLRQLSDRHLLLSQLIETETAYKQHAMLQAFYYDVPGRRERQAMHRQAGTFYETEEPDHLRAALHFQRAEAYEKAAELATADTRTHINQGRARLLRRLLEQFTVHQLSTPGWVAVNNARGLIYTFLRESDLAQASYHEALAQLDTLAQADPVPTDVGRLRARACWGLAGLLEFESPPEALQWLRQGLTHLPETDSADAAGFHIKMGIIQRLLGHYAEALQAIEQGITLLRPGPSRLRVYALLNLGVIHYVRGKTEAGRAATQQGLEMAQQMRDYFQMVDLWTNLAVDKSIAGQWSEAIEHYGQALERAGQLGSTIQQARLNQNLGFLHTARGDNALAYTHFSNGLQMARTGRLREVECACISGLGHLHLRQREPDEANRLLTEAEQLALAGQIKFMLPEIYRGLAQVHLIPPSPQLALDYAQQALTVAQELTSDHEIGLSLGILGPALLVNTAIEPALAAFEQSYALLAPHDPYEAARTQAAWGSYLASGPDQAQGRSLLQSAKATFQGLGARRDLADVEAALAQYQ